jgi:hypothetical protein
VEAVERDVAVLPERDRAHRPKPDRVAAVDRHEIERIDDVAQRLGDLPVVELQVPVHEQLLRNVVASRKEQCRPEDAMEAKDVLAEQVPDLGPELLSQVLAVACIRERAQVVDQRVDPDVDDLILVPRDRHAPGLARAAEAEVLQPARDEGSRLVVAEPRQNEVGPRVIQVEQLLLERRQPEEVVLLLDPLWLDAVLRTLAVDELGLRLERFATDAVEPRVGVLVDVAVVVDPLDEVLDEALVSLVGRADEEVVLGIDEPRQLSPGLGDLVDVRLRIETLILGHPVDLGGVLVRSGEEERLLAALLVMARQDIGRDRRVRVADVRGRVDVVDRRRDVEAAHLQP